MFQGTPQLTIYRSNSTQEMMGIISDGKLSQSQIIPSKLFRWRLERFWKSLVPQWMTMHALYKLRIMVELVNSGSASHYHHRHCLPSYIFTLTPSHLMQA